MRVTRENVRDLIADGTLPEGELVFHIRSGAEALPLPSLFKIKVRWHPEEEPLGAIVTKRSDNYPPFTFYEWNNLTVEEDEEGTLLRFLVQSAYESTPVEILVQRQRVNQT